jgi:hypothetical protein
MNASLAKGFSALLICLRRFNNLNMSDEPEAALVLRANERLVVAVVAERPPGCVNAAAERSFGYVRPCQMVSISSSLLTIRSWLRTK